jgi:L-alanine-DL-glutamate epimerase-like enolase superfamily enzyme
VRLTATIERLPLHTPFRIARGVKDVAEVIVVEIEGEGRTGRGEAVPYPRYGENAPGVLAAIEAVRGAVEGGLSRTGLVAAMPAGAARNAVDAAMWDRERPDPGFVARPLTSALTIGLDAPDAMAAAAARVADAPLLKVKLGADDPAARLIAVRVAAPGPRLIVDPNESWDRAILDAMTPVLVEQRVVLLEQPVPAGADEWLEGYDAGVPICADESFHGADDLAAVARRYQAVNVKLDKTGGLTAALALVPMIRAAGLGLMTGCMISSSLSIAAAWRIAQASDFVDCDGPLWLADDREGGVRNERGILHPPAPGFWA